MFTTIEFYISDITPGLKTKLCEHFAAQKGEVYRQKELIVCRMQLDEDSTSYCVGLLITEVSSYLTGIVLKRLVL